MCGIKVVLFVMFSFTICVADISGKVTDISGTAIPGATVSLERGGESVTTDENGEYSIKLGTKGVGCRISRFLKPNCTVSVNGGFLRVNIKERNIVTILAYDLHGKALMKVQRCMEAGTHFLALPYTQAGVHLYRIKIDNKEPMLKVDIIGSIIQGGSAVIGLPITNTRKAESTTNTARMDDVMSVMKEGFLHYQVSVKKSEMDNMKITLIVCEDTVWDVDGNLYQAVRIGSQVWTTEDLRTTRYIDGTPIAFDTSTESWGSGMVPKYCYFKNTTDTDSIRKWGALYNGYVIQPTNSKRITPEGWHIPTDAEWDILQNYLITNGYNWDGTKAGNKIAKSMAMKIDWIPDTGSGTIGNELIKNNSSGFSAFPGGTRSNYGYFNNIGYYDFWWSATEHISSYLYGRGLYHDSDGLCRNSGLVSCGFSIRLLRDY